MWWAVYGRLAASFGWTFKEIDEMTMWEISDATKYLRHNPPLHEIIGDYFGCRRTSVEDDPHRLGTREELKRLEAEMNKLGG